MDEIYVAIVGSPGQLLAIGLAAVGVLAFILRLRQNRRRQAGEQRRGYNCISAPLAWGGRDDATDNAIKCRSVERITPRGYPCITCGLPYTRDADDKPVNDLLCRHAVHDDGGYSIISIRRD